MSIEGDLVRVTVKGSRESIIKMMNAALKSFKSDNVIADSDDAKTMNSKLEMFAGEEGKDIGIPDLLGQGKEGDSFVRKIEFVRIEDDSRGLVAKFSYYLGEACLYLEDMGYSADYLDSVTNWEAVALQYGCTVFLDDDRYSNGQFIRFGDATIYDASDGELHRLHLESGSIYDDKEYPFFLKTLAHLYPDHYGVDWEHYHSKHPEVEISEDECLAWFNEQKQPWDQKEDSETEEDEPTSQYPIDENGHAVIPEGATRIDDYAFLQCDKLVSVSIPNTVEEIGEGAFGSCKNLISITLPSALKLIDKAAFFGCEKLAGIEIPTGLQRIEARAFAECSSLDDIEIPIGVKVADDAFRDCPCDVAAESSRWNKFKTVKQMTKAVQAAIANGMLRISEELDYMVIVFCTKQYRMVFDYRKNKIFYSIYIKNTVYHSWTSHEEKVLKTFLKMYEFSK